MKAFKTTTFAALAILATSSAAMAQDIQTSPIKDQLESKLSQLIGDLQTAVHLDFLSRDGFYVVGGIFTVLVFYVFSKLLRYAQDADELSRQRRKVKARKQAEAEYEAAQAKLQKGYAAGSSRPARVDGVVRRR